MLHHFSDTMQIESLWKFNKKYDPWWDPRYVVTGPYLRVAGSGLAIARAESVTEIPVIGPLLKAQGAGHDRRLITPVTGPSPTRHRAGRASSRFGALEPGR